jgi:hypothetical protein
LTAWPSRLKIVFVARHDRTSPKLPVTEAVEMTVGEVMITKPKTLPATVLVGDVRQVFEQPSHRTVLLTDDGTFRGAIERERLPADAREDEPAARYADIQPLTVTPAMRDARVRVGESLCQSVVALGRLGSGVRIKVLREPAGSCTLIGAPARRPIPESLRGSTRAVSGGHRRSRHGRGGRSAGLV